MMYFFLVVAFWLTYAIAFRLGRAHARQQSAGQLHQAQTLLTKIQAERRRVRDLVVSARRSAGDL